MKVTLITHTPNPEKTIACAAKLCYADSSIGDLYDGLSDEKAGSFVSMLASLGHESPIEHVSFTFGIEGVSRSLLAQITRHRIASFSVQSQRYVKNDKLSYIIPPQIEAVPEARELFMQTMDADLKVYNALADILQKKHYNAMLEGGVDEKQAKSTAEKMAIEDARFVLPNASETKMVVTMNARSLLNFFRLRCCSRAQWEIKAVADQMLLIVCEIAPTLFLSAGPACYKNTCGEGKMSCGQAQTIKKQYGELHDKALEVWTKNNKTQGE